MPEPTIAHGGTGLTRALTLLVLVLMLAAILYSGWIAIQNWSHIGV